MTARHLFCFLNEARGNQHVDSCSSWLPSCPWPIHARRRPSQEILLPETAVFSRQFLPCFNKAETTFPPSNRCQFLIDRFKHPKKKRVLEINEQQHSQTRTIKHAIALFKSETAGKPKWANQSILNFLPRSSTFSCNSPVSP